MKLTELFESKEYSGPELWKIAHEVGEKAFGNPRTGLIHHKFDKVRHLHFDELPYPDVDTHGWVFYPSNPSKFKDYSDSRIKKTMADADGKIYIALSDGSIVIIETTGKKPYVKYHALADLKKKLHQKFGAWEFTYLTEVKSDEESLGHLHPAHYRGGAYLSFRADKDAPLLGVKDHTEESWAQPTMYVTIKPDDSFELLAFVEHRRGAIGKEVGEHDLINKDNGGKDTHHVVRKKSGSKFSFDVVAAVK